MGWAAVLAAPGVVREAVGPDGAAGGVLAAPVGDPIAFGDVLVASGAVTTVVAVPRALAEQTAAALTMTALRWPHLRTAALVSAHAPLALHAALGAARQHTRQAGVAHAFMTEFLERSWSGVWTPSVAKLAIPAPSLAQYLRSLLPGGQFLVSFAPDGEVGGVGALAARRPSGPGRVLLVADPGLPGVTATRLATDGRAQAVRPYPLAGDWRAVTGHPRAVQVALTPSEQFRFQVMVPRVCPSCAELVGAQLCPFCQIRTAPLAGADPGAADGVPGLADLGRPAPSLFPGGPA
jgi:hypothetical protein